MALARHRREGGLNYWPGFVDALSTLVLGIIFLLTIFVVVQFFLSQEVSGKDTALAQLNAVVAKLRDDLALEATSKVSLATALDSEKALSARARAQVELLNQQIDALRRQLSALQQALDASEKKDQTSQEKIADLGQRLNVALAQRVQELSRYRSDFFGRLRAILGDRPDIR